MNKALTAGGWAALMLAGFAALSARADDSPLMGKTVACDSAQEVQSFVGGKADEQVKTALDRVNHKYGKDACSVEMLVFQPQGKVAAVVAPEGAIEILKVQVVGVVDGSGMKALTEPVTQYVPVKAKGLDI